MIRFLSVLLLTVLALGVGFALGRETAATTPKDAPLRFGSFHASVPQVAWEVRTDRDGSVSPQLDDKARRAPSHATCTDNNWLRTLTPVERWIDWHESRLNPNDREPTTGAYGLGQLLPSTYAALGLPMAADPCTQIAAQRAYLKQHYGGSWAAALAHWKAVAWW